jgi:hypothetical protein
MPREYISALVLIWYSLEELGDHSLTSIFNLLHIAYNVKIGENTDI